MDKMYFNKSIILGGLFELNEENISLRSQQINDGIKIHTCNDYGNSLEVIKNACLKDKKNVRIISKVYFKYPDISHRRFRPIIEQLDEKVSRLGFIPSEWDLQICCYCSSRDLLSKNAQDFFAKVRNDFGIRRIYLEFYQIYNYKTKDILLFNKEYKGIISFGFIGYQNLLNRVFTDGKLNDFKHKKLSSCFIGTLGLGIQNKLSKDFIKSNSNIDFINLNLLYLCLNIKRDKNILGITNVSSLKQYKELKCRFIEVNKLLKDNSLAELIQDFSTQSINFYKDHDHYGGYKSIKNYIKEPKLIFSKFKYNLKSYLKSISFERNFFG